MHLDNQLYIAFQKKKKNLGESIPLPDFSHIKADHWAIVVFFFNLENVLAATVLLD